MLISKISAPSFSQIFAALDLLSLDHTQLFVSQVFLLYFFNILTVFLFCFINALLAIISENTSPGENLLTIILNGKSLTPDIGAINILFFKTKLPTSIDLTDFLTQIFLIKVCKFITKKDINTKLNIFSQLYQKIPSGSKSLI